MDLTLLWILRIALYLQLVLGAWGFSGRFTGSYPPKMIWDWHILLAVVIVVLALVALRPLTKVPNSGARVAARFMPLLPFVFGLGFLFGVIGGTPLVVVHIALALITIGLVEAAAGQQRRALAAP